jgi:hypothetical protein
MLVEPPWTRIATECLGTGTSVGFGGFPEPVDQMANLVFQKWFHFSWSVLNEWPLGYSRHLLFPYGGTHGAAFDGLLPAILVGGLSSFFSLPLAWNLVMLGAFVLLAMTCYYLAVFFWGRGVTAWVTGVSGLMLPYVMQRTMHPNLMHVWTLPVGMLLYFRFAQRPTWKRATAWMLSFPLMAAASWYILMAGLIFQVGASVEFLLWGARAWREVRGRLARLGTVWAGGMGCVLLLAWPMLSTSEGGAPVHGVEVMARYSTPLAQYLLPYPHVGAAGEFLPFRHLQAQVGTLTEGYAGGLIASLILCVLFLFRGGRRSFVRERFLVGLVAGTAFILSAGPYLQTVRFLHARRRRAPASVLPVPPVGRVQSDSCPGAFAHRGNVDGAGRSGASAPRSRESSPRKGKRHRWGFGTVVLLVVVFNALWSCKPFALSFFRLPEVPAFHVRLAAQPGSEAIFDVPANSLFFGRYSYFQFTHKRPIVSSTVFHGADGPLRRFLSEDERHRFFWFEHNRDVETEEMARRVGDPAYLDELARRGIGWVIIHEATLRTVASLRPIWRPPI